MYVWQEWMTHYTFILPVKPPPAPSLLPLAQRMVPTQVIKQAASTPLLCHIQRHLGTHAGSIYTCHWSLAEKQMHTHNINGQAHRLTHAQEHACTLTQPQQMPSETKFLNEQGMYRQMHSSTMQTPQGATCMAAPLYRAQAQAHAGTALH